MNVVADHPAFRGHFPGRPILPAVVVLTEVLAAIEAQTGQSPQQFTIVTAKFVGAVTPGESLTFSHANTASGGIRFEVRSTHGVVASGLLALRRSA
jgi:3-hydroxymyristoyl/3-hydroxydecanoyl-(acyl carrier protein) dehydratase